MAFEVLEIVPGDILEALRAESLVECIELPQGESVEALRSLVRLEFHPADEARPEQVPILLFGKCFSRLMITLSSFAFG